MRGTRTRRRSPSTRRCRRRCPAAWRPSSCRRPSGSTPRGAWRGELPEDEQQLAFQLTSEDGEYRITDPPDALIVRDSWFAQRYSQVSLYFFDPTGRILVPEPVFVPRGRPAGQHPHQPVARARAETCRGSPAPTSRRSTPGCPCRCPTRGSPRSTSAAALRTAGLRGPVEDARPARLDAAPGAGDPGAPGLDRRRGGAAARRRRPVRRQRGVAVRPVRARVPTPCSTACATACMVYGEPDSIDPGAGPFGRGRDHGLRSISVNLDASTAVGVSAGGTSLLSAPVRDQTGEPAADDRSRRHQPAAAGVGLHRPAVGRRPHRRRRPGRVPGERVAASESRVPGVSGRRVRAFLISRDGTRFVAVVRGRDGDELRAGRIHYDGQGGVDRRRGDPSDPARGRRAARDHGHRLDLADLDHRGPPDAPGSTLSRCSTVPVDGAPDRVALDLGQRAGGRARRVSPTAPARRYAVTRDGLVDLDTGATIAVRRRPGDLARVRRLGASPQAAAARLLPRRRGCSAGRMLPDALGDLLLGSRCVGCDRPGRVLCRDVRGHPARRRRAGLAVADSARPGAAVRRRGVRRDGAGDGARPQGARRARRWPRPLGRLLAGAVAAALADRARGPVVLVPVPSRPASVRVPRPRPDLDDDRRAAAWLRADGVPATAAPLLRLRPGVRDQAGLDADERRANLAGSMRCPSRSLARLAARWPRAHVVVCDDVLTTGATAREAQRALEAVGPGGRRRRRGRGDRADVAGKGKFRGFPFAATRHGLTSVYGVRPGPWLRRVGALNPIREERTDPASRCQSQAKRST